MTESVSNYSNEIITPSRNASNIRYAIREVTVLARQLQQAGRRILYLNIGDPNVFDFDIADDAKNAVLWALNNRKCGYAPSEGLPEALQTIERDAAQRLHFRNIVGSYTGNGGSECIDIALTSLLNPGDNVLLPSPTYPIYASILTRLGIEARYYRLDESDGWQPDTAHIESLTDAHTRAIVVINPNNPTGAVYGRDVLMRIIDIANRHNLLIMCDEIYERLVLDDSKKHISMASLSDDACIVTFNGLGKTYLAPGIRIGWAVLTGPKKRMEAYYETICHMLRARLCASHPFQYAIKPCLEGSQSHLPGLLEKLRRRRDLCMSKIAAIPGLSCQAPQGSFYALVRVEGIQNDAEWCKSLLMSKGVVVVPGSGFELYSSDAGYFRIVLLPDENTLAEAFDKIAEFVQETKR